ncbi:MAG: hypothetical protein EB084_08765 [Proteobacteria bacterium]|nr:hypothetical protein [Pseudomonadota bacterium]
MQVPYRVIEVSAAGEWLPIGVALLKSGSVVAHVTGTSECRVLSASSVLTLENAHLWNDSLRVSEVAHCSASLAHNPRRLLAEVTAHAGVQGGTNANSEVLRRFAIDELSEDGDVIIQTPGDALRELKRGNDRFYSGKSTALEFTAVERRAQAARQNPFAIIVSCADSRVPTEFVLDQGPGNLFITRVAGNVLGPKIEASIEYAIRHLHSMLIVVLGHEGCGAVAAAMLPPELRAQETENVRNLLERITPAVKNMPAIRDQKARMREAVVANVRLQINSLRRNQTVADFTAAGKIAVVGGYYSISSGAVDFYESEEDLALSPALTATAGAHA